MTSLATDRRALITGAAAYAAGAVVVTAGLATASHAESLHPAISTAFAALLDDAKRAAAASEHHGAAQFDRARDRYQALVDAIPHTTVQMPGGSSFTTADRGNVACCKAIIGTAKNPRAERLAPHRSLIAAHLRRERSIEGARQQSGLAAAIERDDELGSLATGADDAVYAHPITNATELAAKLAWRVEREGEADEDFLVILLADARRMARGEGC
jgi:hypothetical protein